jgi:hypothetical protein
VDGLVWVVEEGAVADQLPVKAAIVGIVDLLGHEAVEGGTYGHTWFCEVKLQGGWALGDEEREKYHEGLAEFRLGYRGPFIFWVGGGLNRRSSSTLNLSHGISLADAGCDHSAAFGSAFTGNAVDQSFNS